MDYRLQKLRAAGHRLPADGDKDCMCIVLAADGRILGWNSGAAQMTGYSTEAIIGKHISCLLLPDRSVPAFIQHAFEIASDAGRFRAETILVHRNGALIPGTICLIAIYDQVDRPHNFIWTARRLDEAAKRKQTQSDVMAHMNHELRAPLNSILGFTDLLLRGIPGPLNPEQAKHLAMVQASAGQLLQLIDTALARTHMAAGKVELTLTRFVLADLLNTIVESMRPLANQKELLLRLDVDPALQHQIIYSDEGKVRQILLNLLSNSINFTDRGHITLTIRQGERAAVNETRAAYSAPANSDELSELMLQISVSDTGIGIAPGQIPYLFQEYKQGTLLNKQHPHGSGLGLLISRQLISLIGGRVELRTSSQAEGSEFVVFLPLEAPTP